MPAWRSILFLRKVIVFNLRFNKAFQLGGDKRLVDDLLTVDGREKELLRRHYLSRGYADFRVLDVTAELTEDRENFNITFFVEARYALGLTDIESDQVWQCASCGACPSRCPRGVEIVDAVLAMRRIASEYDVLPGGIRQAAVSLKGEGYASDNV